MTIKVLHIIGSLRLGGAQVCLKQLVEHNRDPEIEHFIYPLRSRQVDIPIGGHVIMRPFVNYDPRKLLTIVSLCRRHKIDVIHAHLHKAIIAALLLRFFLNIPVIVHEHGPIARRGFQYSLYRLLLRLLKSKASRFIAVSKAVAGDLQRHAGVDASAIEIIYNAADLQVFSPDAAERPAVRRQLNIDPDDIVIGFVGRMAHVKGPDILLESFDKLSGKDPRCKLVFVGEGDLKLPLLESARQKGLCDRVVFTGFQNDVSRYMNAFDIGCMPSRQEPFGISALEMMSMKIPIVASGVDGLGEFLTDGHNALVPKENTPESIGDCLLRLIEQPDLRAHLAQTAAADVQKFGIDNQLSRINDVYRQICDSKEHAK